MCRKSLLPSARTTARHSILSFTSQSSSRRVARPCRRALFRETNLPSGVRGPVLREALRLFDSILRMEVMVPALLLRLDRQHRGGFYPRHEVPVEGLARAFGKLPANTNLLQRGVQLSAGGAQKAVDGCERHLRLYKCSRVEGLDVIAGLGEARLKNSTLFRIRAPRDRLLPRQPDPIRAVGSGGGVRPQKGGFQGSLAADNQDGILPEAIAHHIPEQVDDGVQGKPFQIGGRGNFIRHHVEQLVVVFLQFIRQQPRAYPNK